MFPLEFEPLHLAFSAPQVFLCTTERTRPTFPAFGELLDNTEATEGGQWAAHVLVMLSYGWLLLG